jgi:hypothetical protein
MQRVNERPAADQVAVVASSDPGGGSIAHLAVGNGWVSTIELINSGAPPAQAHLKFFGDDGSPLPIALTVSGTAMTSSAVDQALAPHARLVIQSTGIESDPLQVGAAQLTSDGTVSGFIRFRYGARGQEASVPVQSRNAGAYLLVFDNTAGLTSEVAVANVSGVAATVPVVIRNNKGSQIGSGAIELPPNGHSAFALTDLFSATANQSGTVEFDTPSGGLISVLGVRSYRVGGILDDPDSGALILTFVFEDALILSSVIRHAYAAGLVCGSRRGNGHCAGASCLRNHRPILVRSAASRNSCDGNTSSIGGSA